MSRRRGLGVGLAGVLLVIMASPALAHADLLSTDPVDGAEVGSPVERIELVFSDAVVPVSGGIQLLEGRQRRDVELFQPNDTSVVVEPSTPLEDGRYALLWAVRSADLHVIEGTLSFAVAPTSGGSTAQTPTSTTLPTISTALPPRALESAPVAVTTPDPTTGEWISGIGRWMMMTGALVAIGALVFAGTTLVGSEEEVRRGVRWVRRGGIAVLAGTAIEVIGVSTMVTGSVLDAVVPSAVGDALGGSFGIAVLLSVAGGIALLQDPRLASVIPIAPAPQDPDPIEGTDSARDTVVVTVAPRRFRLDVKQEWVALAGAAAVAASFMFDGHTSSIDQAVIARGASLVHVIAGGVWFGGLVVMADTLARRWRRGDRLDAAAMSIRFSRSATASLVVVAMAGITLTWIITDGLADLTSTTWGRLLLGKIGLVLVAAALGAYNHFIVVPRIDREPSDAVSTERLQRVVLVEAIVLATVVAVTAVLVGAAV